MGWKNESQRHAMSSRGMYSSDLSKTKYRTRYQIWKTKQDNKRITRQEQKMLANGDLNLKTKQDHEWYLRRLQNIITNDPVNRAQAQRELKQYKMKMGMFAYGISNADRKKIHKFDTEFFGEVKAKEIWGSEKRNLKEALWGPHMRLQEIGEYIDSGVYRKGLVGYIPIKDYIDSEYYEFNVRRDRDINDEKRKLFSISKFKTKEDYLVFFYSGHPTWGGRTEIKIKAYKEIKD